jgi:hypothetical protein
VLLRLILINTAYFVGERAGSCCHQDANEHPGDDARASLGEVSVLHWSVVFAKKSGVYGKSLLDTSQ